MSVDIQHRVIAILRGIKPNETGDIVQALIDAGLRTIEVPLNSPDPLRSIEVAAKIAPPDCLVGAGTVLDVDQVEAVKNAGGQIIVSPNMDSAVVAKTIAMGMLSYPGVFSPTEALAAEAAGATGLKFFPASLIGPDGIKAIRAVLKPGTKCYAVGGAGPSNFADYLAAGAYGFGIGSNLYKPGATAGDVAEAAKGILASFDKAMESAA